MTRYDFELEVMAFFELRQILSGDKPLGPSKDFLAKARELIKQQQQGTPITPKEVGWE